MRGTSRWTGLAVLALMAIVASTTTVLPLRASPAEAQATDADPPSVPTAARWSDTTTGVLTVSVAAEDGRARASWRAATDAVSGVASYRIQVDTHPDFAQPVLERSVSAASGSLVLGPADGLRYGSAYYFRVAAVDGAGNTSAWSAASNRLLVTDQTTGPAIVHAPVATAYVGQDIPVSLTATCEGEERACAARLFWRSTPIAGIDAARDLGDQSP